MTAAKENIRYVDTNVILRYLLDDDPVLSPQARVYLEDETGNRTGIEVVAEAIYVLAGVYDVPREEIATTLQRLFDNPGWVLDHKESVLESLEIYRRSSLDFVDAWIVALHRVEGVEVLSFDKKIRRMTQKHP